MTSKVEDGVVLANHFADLLTEDFVLNSIFRYSNFKRWGFSFDFPKVCYNHVTGDITWPTEEVEEIRSKLLSKEQYLQLVNELKQINVEYRKYLIKFEKNLSKAREDPKIIEEFFNECLKMGKSIAWHILELPLALELEKAKIPPNAIITNKTETSKAWDELKEISLHKNPDLAAFQHKYGYLGMKYFQGQPWTIDQISEMLKEVPSAHKKDVLPSSKSNNNNNFYLTIAQEIVFSRTEKWESICYGCSLFRKMVEKYFSDLINYDDLLNLQIEEAIQVLSGKMKYSSNLIKGREQFILHIEDAGVNLILLDHVNVTKDHSNLSELRGQIACQGIVRGIAKVVLSPKKCSKVEKGDILIATMSTPDFLPAMGRAAAFVTDIGGMTCHAAIVAREMGKPCVIGTEIATKTFKDGDLIEVDATNGIVRKIK